MISETYRAQVDAVLAIATDHNETCAYNVIVAAEENAALDGVTLDEDRAVDQALEMISILCRCEDEITADDVPAIDDEASDEAPRLAVTTDRHPVLHAGERVTVLREESDGYVVRLDTLHGEEIWVRSEAVRLVPTGAETYADAMGRTQWRVAGPNGTFLVTRSDLWRTFDVWRSDSLNTIARDRDLHRALEHAAYYAGADH